MPKIKIAYPLYRMTTTSTMTTTHRVQAAKDCDTLLCSCRCPNVSL